MMFHPDNWRGEVSPLGPVRGSVRDKDLALKRNGAVRPRSAQVDSCHSWTTRGILRAEEGLLGGRVEKYVCYLCHHHTQKMGVLEIRVAENSGSIKVPFKHLLESVLVLERNAEWKGSAELVPSQLPGSWPTGLIAGSSRTAIVLLRIVARQSQVMFFSHGLRAVGPS